MFSLQKIAISALLTLIAITQLIPSASAQGFFYANPGYSYNSYMPYNYGGYGFNGYNPYPYGPMAGQFPMYGYNSYNAYGGYPGGYPGAYSYGGYSGRGNAGLYTAIAASTALGVGMSLLQNRMYYRNYRNSYRGYGYPYYY